MIEANVTFTGNLAQWERDDRAATDGALKDVASAVRNALHARLLQGYRSGRYVEGDTASSLEVSRLTTVKGERTIRVGANSKLGGWKARLWELGHLNAFTKRFERVEHWKSTLMLMHGRIPALFRAAYEARMLFWRSTPSDGRRSTVRAL